MLARRAALGAAAVLTVAALAGCTQEMPATATGTVVSSKRVQIQKVVHHKLCLAQPDGTEQCGYVSLHAYKACHKGDQYPACKDAK